MRVLIGLLLNLYLLSSCSFEDSLSLDNYTLDISYEENIIRPNILIFLVDDLREDATPYLDDPLIEYFPAIDKIQKEGTRFSNSFVTTSLCSPSRASILSGLYASRHKVLKNDDTYNLNFSIGTIFEASQYNTAFIGKWHMGDKNMNPFPQKGWDSFISFFEQGEYKDPEMIINGNLIKTFGHITNILTDHAIKFITNNQKQDQDPFLLLLSHKAVHHPFEPMDEHKTLFEDLERNFEFPESFSQSVCYNNSPLADPNNLMYFKKRYRNYYQSLKGIDFSLERILNTLVDLEILNKTLIIFMSDNGYFHGEHQLIDKRYAYEEAIRIPLIIRYPKIFSPNSISNKIILNIDILPTILKACFIKIHNFSFDGYSIQEFDEQEIPRNFFLYQFFENKSVEIKQYPEIKAIRSMNYKLITYPNSLCFDEFYDLNLDPSETKNLIYDIKYNNIIQDHYQYLLSETMKFE